MRKPWQGELKFLEQPFILSNEGTDTGPIIAQKAVEIKQGDTPEVLQRRIMEQAEWVIMPKAIDDIANGRIKVEEGKVIYL